ncbi:MAG: ATP-binding cassette domain-containing protein, partial [Lachnospiraceae bacterium]|nr:ATP-binding cassette domain-containing protein [Lachnospiraceae bacterium]
NMTRVMMRDQVKLDSTTLSAVAMIEDIKASGAENGYFEMWAGYQASANRQSVRYEKLNQVFGMVPEILSTLMNALILLTGIRLVIRGDFTSGMLLAFQGLLASFIRPAQSLIESQQKLQQLRTRMERIEDVMKYPEDIMLPAPGEEAGAVPVKEGKLRGRIEMRDVTFGYSPLEAPLIEHFNLVVEPGKSVAFVGGTGCGKSTLTRLLSGLYQPWSGEILLDGKPLTEIDRRILTASLAVVEQDITLFEDTVENNIKLWDRTIEDFEMILAARDARIHENILKKEGGYQSMILEGGGGFSGGERQRIGIAGALVKDPSILIMDEATSALDSGSEYEITKAVRDRGITRVIVAHRLSTIRDCDEIIVMDHGKAVERGTHESLMELNGLYKELVMNA